MPPSKGVNINAPNQADGEFQILDGVSARLRKKEYSFSCEKRKHSLLGTRTLTREKIKSTSRGPRAVRMDKALKKSGNTLRDQYLLIYLSYGVDSTKKLTHPSAWLLQPLWKAPRKWILQVQKDLDARVL